MCPNIFISAGEASGEHYGTLLIDELQRQLAARGQTAGLAGRASFVGMGGNRMAAAGLHRIVRSEDMAVMGITEVVRHLPRIYREFRKLKRAIAARPPDVAILIDFPDIHFKLAEQFHQLGVPVIFFVSPQLWAWKKHRIKLVQKYVTRMLVIFPFEELFYRERGVNAEFVGHPLAELPLPTVSREQFAAENGLNPAAAWIALLPGSRPKEIRDNLPEMLAAAQMLVEPLKGAGLSGKGTGLSGKGTGFSPYIEPGNRAGLQPPRDAFQDVRMAALQFLIPQASTLNTAQRAQVRTLVGESSGGLSVHLVDDARAALFHARASIVASGTATVEAALIGNPFVVVYRVSPLTYAIAKRVVTVPHVAMCNLIAGKRVVPELIQNDFTAANIVQQIEPLLPDGEPRQSMMQELTSIAGLLRPRPLDHGQSGKSTGAIERVAAITMELLETASPALDIATHKS